MKVTAAIIAYNHEKSLAAAVGSALMQIADFDFEIVVAEDHSTDGTRAVLQDLQQRHPDKIRAICREKNLGANANFIEALPFFRGDYVALLEGDDRWTDPRKLQRQVDYLDAHADCSLCCHAVNYVHDDGSRPPERFPASAKRVSSLEDVLSGANFHTSSYMFRRRLLPRPPDWLRTLWIGDWPILMLLAEQGNVGYIDETMSEYRIHPGGVWSGSSRMQQFQGLLDTFWHARKHLGTRCSALTAWLVASRACRLSRELELAGRRQEARRHLLEAVEVLLEETPADQLLIDGLMKSVSRLAGQMPTAASLEVARLQADIGKLRAEVARQNGQLASVTGELALLKASRFWRMRRVLTSVPGLRQVFGAFRRFAPRFNP